MSTNYNFGAIRAFLLAGFSAEELKRFTFDRPDFRPVYNELASGMGKAAVVDRLLAYSDEKGLLGELLAELKKLNPRQYANYEGQLIAPAGAGPVSDPAAGAAPTPTPPHTLTPPPLEKAWVRFKLQIGRLNGPDFEVEAIETPMGEVREKGRLPYRPAELSPLLKALKAGRYNKADFSGDQVETLKQHGLLHNPAFAANLHQRIGEKLYQALFPGKVGMAFTVAFSQARPAQQAVGLQLRFDPEAVDLAGYPWELLHDGQRALLSGGAVELTRYISYPEAPTPLRAAPPWRLLYIAARPSDAAPLPPDQEQLAVYNSLQAAVSGQEEPPRHRDAWSTEAGATEAVEGQQLTLDLLTPPTYDRLLDVLGAGVYHIIHFDGHGLFARRCPRCGKLNFPHRPDCAQCQGSLDGVRPGGFLAFENQDGQADYVETPALENARYGNQVRLAVLSACESGMVRGDTLFGGVGPGLIRAGIPAVVAMQVPIGVDSAVNFARGFYAALTQGDTIPRAVAQGRRRLYRDQAYFIPALYLRSSDDEGRLFERT